MIIGYPKGSEGKIIMIKANILTVHLALYKKKRRFEVYILVRGFLDNMSDRERRDKTVEKIFQSVAEWYSENYMIILIDYSKRTHQILIGDSIKTMDDRILDRVYNITIYMDGSIQMLESGFGVYD